MGSKCLYFTVFFFYEYTTRTTCFVLVLPEDLIFYISSNNN